MTTPTGSMLVQVFESAWRDIQTRHPEIPNVVFVSGGGLTVTTKGVAIKWGHFGPNHWDTEDGKAHELFVSGESLSRPAHETMETLLHEAAHALCHVRGIKDTSRNNLYHNKRFVKAAEELGLMWPEGKEPCTTRGFSSVVIRPETMIEYAATIDRLETNKIAWRDLMGLTFGDGDGSDGNGGETPGGDGGSVKGPRKPRSRNTKPKWICECPDAEEFAIWAARRTMERKRVLCGNCGEAYKIHPDYE